MKNTTFNCPACEGVINLEELPLYFIFTKNGVRYLRFRCPHCDNERNVECTFMGEIKHMKSEIKNNLEREIEKCI